MVSRLHIFSALFPNFAENERDTPNSGKGDDCVDNSADEGVLSAEKPGNGIELKQPNSSPIQGADDGKDQRNTIHNHKKIHPFLAKGRKLFGRTQDRPFANSFGQKEKIYVSFIKKIFAKKDISLAKGVETFEIL